MASVRLDSMLREFLPRTRLSTDAVSVRSMIEDLERQYPRIRSKLRDETGRLRPYVRVFVNGEDVHELNGLDTPIGAADSVDVLHSIQGG
ncbi:MAG: MoaD/ThiS family protein [Thermoplasmata archaeon]|nr:MoaD/ThiS family protein [Thermoplasmata archaeon]